MKNWIFPNATVFGVLGLALDTKKRDGFWLAPLNPRRMKSTNAIVPVRPGKPRNGHW